VAKKQKKRKTRVNHLGRTATLLTVGTASLPGFGWEVDTVERSFIGRNLKKDWLGFADMIGLDLYSKKKTLGWLCIQVCGYTGFAEHRRKLEANWWAWKIVTMKRGRVLIVQWRKRERTEGGRKVWIPIVWEWLGEWWVEIDLPIHKETP